MIDVGPNGGDNIFGTKLEKSDKINGEEPLVTPGKALFDSSGCYFAKGDLIDKCQLQGNWLPLANCLLRREPLATSSQQPGLAATLFNLTPKRPGVNRHLAHQVGPAHRQRPSFPGLKEIKFPGECVFATPRCISTNAF